MAVETTRRKFSRPVSRISTVLTPHGEMHDGYVFTAFGIIEVLAFAGPGHPMTALTFYYSGHEYRRTFEKYYKPRHIITLAYRFARDVRWDKWQEQPASDEEPDA